LAYTVAFFLGLIVVLQIAKEAETVFLIMLGTRYIRKE